MPPLSQSNWRGPVPGLALAVISRQPPKLSPVTAGETERQAQARWRPLALGAILLLAVCLRLFWLGRASLQVDEAMTLLAAVQWRSNPHFDVHPPLFPAMVAAWSHLGTSEAWLRGLGVLGSGLNLAFWFPLALRLGLSRRQTMASALLLALSFADWQQARELRMYAWLGTWGSLYLLATLSGRHWPGWLALLAALYTHVFAVFLLPLGWLCGASRARVAAGQALALVCWLPWAWHQAQVHREHLFSLRQVPSPLTWLEALGRVVSGRIEPFGDPLSIGLGALLLGWLVWRRARAPALLYAWALLPGLVLFLASAVTPWQLFEFKYLTWTLPAWAGLLAISADSWLLLLVWTLVNLSGLGLWVTGRHVTDADWRGVAAYVGTLTPGPAIVVHPSMMSAPLLYYGLGGPRLQPIDEWTQLRPGAPLIWISTPHHPYVVRQNLLAGVGRYWKRQSLRTFPAALPSAEIQVSVWSWSGPQAFSPSAENQRSSKEGCL